MSTLHGRDLVVGITPFEEPNARLAVAVERAGGLGVLDLGRDRGRASASLAGVCRWWRGSFGVRVPPGCAFSLMDLPDRVDTVLCTPDSPWDLRSLRRKRRILVEVTSLAQAREAVRAGAGGLIAKGNEAGGRVGETTTFVLLQQLLADPELRTPVWAAGGIGLHTAAAAIAGGAVGVVLDTQLALVSEADLATDVAAVIRAMDGTQTAVVGGHRIYVRPDLPMAASMDAEAIALRLGAGDLRTQLLPVGQDGAFARPLAERHVTAGGVVTAVRASIASHLRSAVAAEPLAAGSRFATAHGVRYPVAQGPMTRVSDRAAFAAAVADAGGLPFLALALLTGGEARALLDETAALLGDRPWGVGILGFVPAKVRAAQLEIVHDVHPPCALIAGGRPAQAVPLEAAGITTFLHVPSPGLLGRFLREGARRFVFEGRECGGHVGPRASFPLWEAQIEQLLAFGSRPESESGFFEALQVLFAGGVHDERSAAMVAALAAPLADAGAGLGVLMGTAYLFTAEAVETGAVLAGFQQAALACDRTVLLETSPGHATRCVDSTYVGAFLEQKRRLGEEGVPREELWAQLERFNLGRLRLASKGLRRDDGRLVQVDEDAQRRDGMFMVGEVATLRSSITTIKTLHTQVADGATGLLAARAADLGLPPSTADAGADGGRYPTNEPLDVAIVGMACLFPKAGDLASYWANIVGGVDAVTEVPTDRWDIDVYYDPEALVRDAGKRTPSRWGGFLPDVPFDAIAYGIPPASLAGIEPVQLLALEVSARALADAGYADRQFNRERTAVIFGAEAGTDLASAYGFRSFYPSYFGPLPPALDEHLPHLTEDSFPGLLANVIAGRVANRLDLGGANYTVDAACASSLAALDLAGKELRTGTSDMVLCGGADLHNSIHDYLLFASVRALSPMGRCRTFDSSASGITLGEGVACVVLKRLADAERDGDRVYAVVKGVAGSSDGRSLGLTAPRPEGQRRALERAYSMAGVSPAVVGLIEAHGTGTVVGDRTELATLTEVFAGAGAAVGGCALGSVKSQIGHTKCAAGLAGLIKAARALYAGVRPPTGHLTTPNEYWDRRSSPFFFDVAARPWTASPSERVAGVSAFGFGGTNFHAVLAAYDGAPEPVHGLDEWPAELFAFHGTDRATAARQMDRLAQLLAANDAAGRPWRLRDLARTVSAQPASSGHRVWVALVADDLDDLAAKLDRARGAFSPDPKNGVFVAPASRRRGGQIAFLFPGQGSQRPGMLADLFVAFPRLRRFLRMGERWLGAMFPPAAFTDEESTRQREAFTDTRVAQPALGVAGLAMHELLTSLGVRPDLAAGHSYGELVALCVAGAIDEAELFELSEARGQAILDAAAGDRGRMAAIAATPDRVRTVIADDEACQPVVIANHNAPTQVVISGPTPAIEAALARLAEQRLGCRRIPVACAFHSPVVAGAAAALAEELGRRAINAPALPVWSNAAASPYPADPEAVRSILARQVAEPVRFVEQVEAMYEAGARIFVEAGPGQVLTQLVGQILRERPHAAVACDLPDEHGLRRLLFTLAELATAGVPVDVTPLFHGRDANIVSASAAPRRPGWIVNGHLVRTADGQYLAGGLRPAAALPAPAAPAADAAGVTDAGRDTAVIEFLRSVRELVAAQRDVLLGYLGAPVERVPSAPIDDVVATGDSQAAAGEPSPASEAVLTPDHVLATVLAAVSERTGYPQDMLDPDLDLEADLGIDSIKRTEILGELTDRIQGSGTSRDTIDEAAVEELARLRTLRGIVEWITSRSSGGSSPQPRTVRAEVPPPRAHRYVVQVAPLPPLDPPAKAGAGHASATLLAGRRVVIVEDGLGVGLELSVLLQQRGAEVLMVTPGDDLLPDQGGADVIVHLAAIDHGRLPVLPSGFAALREAAVSGTRVLLVATGSGGTFGHRVAGHAPTRESIGAGLRGLVRTIGHEFPNMIVRTVDVDPKDEPSKIAGHLLAELGSPDSPVVVGYTNGTRATLRVVPAPLTAIAHDLEAAARHLGIGPASVVLLTGGARGITASVAIGLARVTGCHIELIGRTPSPTGDEDPVTARALDRAGIRRALIEQGIRVPAEVEAAASRLVAARELRSSLSELTTVAASVRYHCLDVRDRMAVRAAVDGIYARHGRLDGVVHGAGVLEDGLLRAKTAECFARVFATKVDGARALAEALRPDLGFLVLFGSVSGVFGNRGQADYAAANDALDTLARMWSDRFRGRVVAVDWGPWAPGEGGMVSVELQREYARRGIGVIEHDDGVACLFSELAWGDQDTPQVVYMCAAPAAFENGSGANRAADG